MKTILKSLTLQIPEGVTLTLKAREITVKGPRGTIVRSFKHMPIDISFTDDTEREIVIERWFTSGKANASIRTCHSHITNAIIGVTKVLTGAARSARRERLIPFRLGGRGRSKLGRSRMSLAQEQRLQYFDVRHILTGYTGFVCSACRESFRARP